MRHVSLGPAAGAALRVATLITDVRGCTRVTAEHGDTASARLAATFARIARESVRAQ